jgi:peptide/nickel transport system substrate-binding protein
MTIRRRTLLGAALAAPALHAARAAPGNVLRIAIGTTPNTLDPMLTTIGDEYIYDVLVFNGLTRISEDLKLEGDLAEKWAVSADTKTWTFTLRPDVKFHNGSVLVADDVVAFFKRMMDPATTAPARSQYDMIESVAAPDATTVVFTLSIPYGGFADILGDRQVKITPRGIDAAKTPIGTGPFKFVITNRSPGV